MRLHGRTIVHGDGYDDDDQDVDDDDGMVTVILPLVMMMRRLITAVNTRTATTATVRIRTSYGVFLMKNFAQYKVLL